ncbi:MAG: type I DNA topoisomerase, partial [FCB group bacterium]|nr:type I DNA topoisomerase [FCB group bacterium]
MPKSLLIVESPAKAKTLMKFLGKDFMVKASVGHILDLPPDRLGVDIENDFKPEFQIIAGKEKVIAELKEASGKADTILIATDPDREGEAIAFHVKKVLNKSGPPPGRVLFHEITKPAVLQAVANPSQIDMNLVDAQLARRVLDRLVGYQVSPFLWKTVAKGLSAGRVQSVALRIICEREAEILAFISQEYWTIEAELTPASKETFRADVTHYKNKKLKISLKEQVDKHLPVLQTAEYRLQDRSVSEVKKQPPPPLITSTLQQAADRNLRFGAKKTMRIAQTLYEGVEIGDRGATGLITYMRTDSVRVSPIALKSARETITNVYGLDYLPAKPRYYKNKESSQDAHEAIRPTDLSLTPDKIKSYLSPEQSKLYRLIYNRFLASQMKEAVYNQTTLQISADDYTLKAVGKVLIFRGFLAAWGVAEEEDTDKKKEAKIPVKISVGENLKLEKLYPEQHFTEPPPRYSESALVKELDEKGVGRPSTYASIISTLFDRKYIESQERKLHPTELGNTVNNILVNNFPDVFSVEFTAKMEKKLDSIEQGSDQWPHVVQDFYTPFSETLQSVMERRQEIKKSLQVSTGEKCEKCGSEMVIKWGRNGRFMACSAFPKCRNTKPLEEEKPVESGKKCEKCGAPLLVKTGRYGRFLGCSNYPKCDFMAPFDTGVQCPNSGCDGKIIERRSK